MFDWSKVDPEHPERAAKARETRVVDFVTLKGAEKLFKVLEQDLNEFYERFSAARSKRTESDAELTAKAENPDEDQG